MKTKILLGGEDDESLQAALLAILHEMGAELEPAKWRHGGSQVVVTRRVVVNGKRLKLESETYMGMTLSGDRESVEAVAARLRSRISP